MRPLAGLLVLGFVLTASPALAQLNGENVLGDMGVGTGTQPAPGVYVAGLFYAYDSDTIRNADGDRLTLDPSKPGDASLRAFAPLIVYVTKTKILGANYGMMAALPFASGSIEAPALGFGAGLESGLGDLYFLPLTLGWRLPNATVNAGAGFYAPTGRYEAGADNNLGKGMWSWELSAGTTVFLDEKKSWTVATSAFWETHTKKADSDTKVGQLMTLEGGVGKGFLQGAMSVGAAYYAQWKLTDDRFGIAPNLPGGLVLGKHRVYGLGPDVTIPIATKSRLLSLVNVRYLWEMGARVKTAGNSFVMTATFPVPSVRLN